MHDSVIFILMHINFVYVIFSDMSICIFLFDAYPVKNIKIKHTCFSIESSDYVHKYIDKKNYIVLAVMFRN